MTTRVVIYTRVSHPEQAKRGFSLTGQRTRLLAFARSKGWRVVGIYTDPGHSGRSTRRPGYRRMMANIAHWDTMLVARMDRSHRNARNFMDMMDELRKKRKDFASLHESLDTTTAIGRAIMDILQRLAQLESDQIGERVREGIHTKVTTTKKHIGEAPLGYDYDKRTKRLKVNAQGRKLVRWIFNAYVNEKLGLQAIADILNLRSVPKHQAKNKGTPWTVQTVRRIIADLNYLGHSVVTDVVRLDVATPLVDEGTFWKAQAIRNKKKRTKENKERDRKLNLLKKALRKAGRRYG
ncbi:MAG TPA: recombinase family protein [Candidatus Thermoplasmatota archaeon]|nr:recombinase family protein [Candidatus Thermoplasmatota archaeon]